MNQKKEDIEKKVIELIFEELRKAEDKFPNWPADPVHGAAILAEEAGELMKATLDYYYWREKTTTLMTKEAAQTAAMAIRFLIATFNVEKKGEFYFRFWHELSDKFR